MFIFVRSPLQVSPSLQNHHTSALRQANFLHLRTRDHHRVSTRGCLAHDATTSMVMTVRVRGELVQSTGRVSGSVRCSQQLSHESWVPLSSVVRRMYNSRRLRGWKCAREASSTIIVRSSRDNSDGPLLRVWTSDGSCVFHCW